MEPLLAQLTVVVLGPEQLTMSMYKEILLMLKRSPNYCFLAQSRDQPSSIILIDSGGTRCIRKDTVLDQSIPASSEGPVSAVALVLLHHSAYCVFSSVDFSLPSASSISSAAIALGTPIYFIHCVKRLRSAYLQYTESASVSVTECLEVDFVNQIIKDHMVGDLKQHFTVMNWAIDRLDMLRDRLLLQYPPPAHSALEREIASIADEVIFVTEGTVAPADHLDITDILTLKSDATFRAFCLKYFSPQEDKYERPTKRPRASGGGISTANRLLYVNETGLLSLSDTVQSPSHVASSSSAISSRIFDLPHDHKPNSLAKLLSFSNYYYGGGSHEHDLYCPVLSPLFDDEGVARAAKKDTLKIIGKRPVKSSSENADSWVPAVAVSENKYNTNGDDLVGQNSAFPLLSQISVISNSAEDIYRQNSEGTLQSNFTLLGAELSQVELIHQDAGFAMSQETDDTIIEEEICL